MSKLNINPTAKVKVKKEIKKESKLDKLNKILDEVRPTLERDGGNLELISYDEKKGIVEVSFQSACAHCPLAGVTLKHLIEVEIRAKMPEIKEIRAV